MAEENQANINLNTIRKRVWFYDLETFKNFHCAIFKCRDSDDRREFVIFNDRNDIIDYIAFLRNEVSGLIGFNCINYDYPMLHFLISQGWQEDANRLNEELYATSQRIIKSEFPDIKKPIIPQLDLYKIWHFDNKNKATSLKYVEVGIRFHNVEDMPVPFDHIVQPNEVKAILDYNQNDVDATEAF